MSFKLERRITRKPDAVSVRLLPAMKPRSFAKIVLPSLRTKGISLSGWSRAAIATSASSFSKSLMRLTQKFGSQVPSPSMKPTRSASVALKPSLIAAP